MPMAKGRKILWGLSGETAKRPMIRMSTRVVIGVAPHLLARLGRQSCAIIARRKVIGAFLTKVGGMKKTPRSIRCLCIGVINAITCGEVPQLK